MSNKFSVYPGRFPCKTCNEEVKTVRVYIETGIASWMCSNKHLSKIQLFKIGYKTKKKNDREE